MKTMTRAFLLGAAVALTSALPIAVSAEGHTNAFFGNKGFVGTDNQARPVTNQSYGGKYGGHSTRTAGGISGAFCPPGFYGMYRGCTYCKNGKALPLN